MWLSYLTFVVFFELHSNRTLPALTKPVVLCTCSPGDPVNSEQPPGSPLLPGGSAVGHTDDHGSLSHGAVAGIAVGGAVFAIGVLAAACSGAHCGDHICTSSPLQQLHQLLTKGSPELLLVEERHWLLAAHLIA